MADALARLAVPAPPLLRRLTTPGGGRAKASPQGGARSLQPPGGGRGAEPPPRRGCRAPPPGRREPPAGRPGPPSRVQASTRAGAATAKRVKAFAIVVASS